MKQTIYKITCILVAAFITLFSFAVPSFADSSYDSSYVYSLPVVEDNSSSVSSSGIHLYNFRDYPVFCGSTSPNTYIIFIADGKDWLLFNPSQSYKFCWINISNNSYYSYSSTSEYGLDYANFHDSGQYAQVTDFLDLKTVPDFDTALSLALSFISPAVNYNFTTPVDVEPGTVLYVGVNAGQTLTLSGTTRFPYRSTLLGGDFPQSSQRLAQTSSLPSGDVQFPLSNSISIPWVKADPLNILGQSFNAQFSADALANNSILSFSGNGFLTIYNPYFVNVEGFNDAGGLNQNPTLHLNISGYSSLRTYSIQDEILHGSNPGGYDKSWTGNISDNGNGTGSVSWEAESASGADTSDMSSTPSNSNYNGGSVPSSESIIQGIANTLTNFANSLISLVSSPVSHINQLISSGSGFMNGLRGLYSWLPGDIQSHLISALTLVITIGVFKVFL